MDVVFADIRFPNVYRMKRTEINVKHTCESSATTRFHCVKPVLSTVEFVGAICAPDDFRQTRETLSFRKRLSAECSSVVDYVCVGVVSESIYYPVAVKLPALVNTCLKYACRPFFSSPGRAEPVVTRDEFDYLFIFRFQYAESRRCTVSN